MGLLLHSSAVVHEPIKLSFGVVSGVGPGIDVRNRAPHASRRRGSFWGFGPLISMVYFVREMYSTRA